METNTTNYYDINAILADEQRIKCSMRPLVEQTQQLDTDTDSNESTQQDEAMVELSLLLGIDEMINESTVVPMPYWLASVLAKREIVTLMLSPCYNEGLELYAQEPEKADFSRRPHFYDIGGRLAALMNDGSKLFQKLNNIFGARYRGILNRSALILAKDYQMFVSSLDTWEANLFGMKYESSNEMHRWQCRSSNFIEPPRVIRALSNITNGQQPTQQIGLKRTRSVFGAGSRISDIST